MATTWPGAGMGSSSSSSKKKSKKTKKSQSAAKRYEKKVESGRERGIRQSQTGSKYDKDVAKVAREHGLALQHKAPPGREDPTGAVQEYNRQQRIASGTATDEDKRQIQNIANITGKNPYGAQTVGGITTLEKERELGTTTTDGKTEKEQYDTKEDFWDEENKRWDIRKVRQNIPFFQQLTGRKIAFISADGMIHFADELGGKATFMKLADALNRVGAEWTGFQPGKALTEGGMGDQGKAALYHKLSGMSPSEFRDFLNRKGNLDRIREFSGDMSPSAMADFEAKLKAASAEGGVGGQFFADMIASTGGEDFQMMQLKNSPNKADRQKYYELNPHLLQTSGGLEEAARAGVSYIPGFGPVERPEGQGGGISDLGGGVGGDIPTDPTTDPTTTTVPDYILRQQYMPGFTPDYSGGPEQMQIAGGYWDPVTQKWIGQGPWGTQGQYQAPPVQANQGGYIAGINPILYKNQGGMVNDGGIKSFKKYGY